MELNLKAYLGKFKGAVPHETKVRNAVITAVHEVLGITLERSKIAVSRDSVSISGPAALRSEIAVRRVKILARMKELEPNLIIKIH